MAQQSQPDSSNSFPDIGSLAGLLLTRAMFGVGVFGVAVAVFGTIRGDYSAPNGKRLLWID